jgi:hypothetical protein
MPLFPKKMTFSPYDSVLSVARCLSDDFQQGREAAFLSLMYKLVQAGVHSDVEAEAFVTSITSYSPSVGWHSTVATAVKRSGVVVDSVEVTMKDVMEARWLYRVPAAVKTSSSLRVNFSELGLRRGSRQNRLCAHRVRSATHFSRASSSPVRADMPRQDGGDVAGVAGVVCCLAQRVGGCLRLQSGLSSACAFDGSSEVTSTGPS